MMPTEDDVISSRTNLRSYEALGLIKTAWSQMRMTEEQKKDNVCEGRKITVWTGFNWAEAFDVKTSGQQKVAFLSYQL